jgi:hypothetical protein
MLYQSYFKHEAVRCAGNQLVAVRVKVQHFDLELRCAQSLM